jgi:enoyl-CoA hydratase/carnithine racemase
MNFETLSLREDGNVLHVTINNPPINLLNTKMVQELFMLGGSMMQRKDIHVVVFDSADADFFLAHFDLEDLKNADDPEGQSKYPDINVMQSVALNWQAIPQLTIAKVNGRVRGAGLEFIMALDMCFVSEDSKLCFPEASGGFLACGGGVSRTFIAAGQSRALEFLLSARDFSGVESERYNIVNRALPEAELDDYVDTLVNKLRKRSPEVVAMHREVFTKFTEPMANTFFDALSSENDGFRAALESGTVQASAERQLKVGQTREVELDLPDSLEKLADSE